MEFFEIGFDRLSLPGFWHKILCWYANILALQIGAGKV